MFVDSHCHLTFEGLAGRIDAVRAAMREARVDRALVICTTLEEFDAMHALAKGHEELWCSAGVHPDNEGVREPRVEELVALASRPRDVAIGETGPDYYRLGVRTVADMAWQRERFRTHIRAARLADYRHDAWGVDVTISGSQKGLMLPPGIGFNALSPKALARSKQARMPRSYWGWDEIVELSATGYWPYTPNTNLLYGLSEALDMLLEQGLPAVFARHQRWAGAVRAAVQAWGLPIQCADPAVYSPVLTGVFTPRGVDADAVRRTIHERFDLSLGTGLGKIKGRMFRIGHLGDCNDLKLMATLAGVEMGLTLAGATLAGSGVTAAMDHFSR